MIVMYEYNMVCVPELLNTIITLILLFLFIKYYSSREFSFCFFIIIPAVIVQFLLPKLF